MRSTLPYKDQPFSSVDYELSELPSTVFSSGSRPYTFDSVRIIYKYFHQNFTKVRSTLPYKDQPFSSVDYELSELPSTVFSSGSRPYTFDSVRIIYKYFHQNFTKVRSTLPYKDQPFSSVDYELSELPSTVFSSGSRPYTFDSVRIIYKYFHQNFTKVRSTLPYKDQPFSSVDYELSELPSTVFSSGSRPYTFDSVRIIYKYFHQNFTKVRSTLPYKDQPFSSVDYELSELPSTVWLKALHIRP